MLSITQQTVGGPAAAIPSWVYPAIAGWILGVLSTLLGSLINHYLEREREVKRENRAKEAERARFAAAVAAELEGLLQRYMQVGGQELGRANNSSEFQSGMLPRFNYFAVFDSNLSKVGLLRERDATRLVATYIQAKGHMDNLITYGELVVPAKDQDAIDRFFAHLKRDHGQLTQSVPQVVSQLKSYTQDG